MIDLGINMCYNKTDCRVFEMLRRCNDEKCVYEKYAWIIGI